MKKTKQKIINNKKHYFRMLVLLIIHFLYFINQTNAQDSSKNKIKLSGSINAFADWYSVSGIEARQIPFMYRVTGNPTISYGDFRLPIDFSYGNLENKFRQPFNKLGASPEWKWAKIHLGYRNIKFSEFTLNNHTFLGVGFEANPAFFRFGFVQGRFQKAVKIDTLASFFQVPAFQRNGYVAKFGVGKKDNFIDFILLRVQDDLNSLNENEAGFLNPSENAILSINSKLNFFDRLYLSGEFAGSLLTSDLRSDTLLYDLVIQNRFLENTANEIRKLIEPRYSTSFHFAAKADAEWRSKKFRIGLNYRRISPGYQTMGRFFFRNDVESLSGKIKFALLKNKIRINARGGLERNNIYNQRSKTSNRKVGSLNLFFIPNNNFSLNANYSNFQNVQEISTSLSVDTLELRRISQNAYLMLRYSKRGKKWNQIFSSRLGFQALNDGGNTSNSDFYKTNAYQFYLQYQFNYKKINGGIAPNFTFLKYENFFRPYTQFRFGLNLNKRFYQNKLRLFLSNNFILSNYESNSKDKTFNFNFRTSYQFHKKQRLGFRFMYFLHRSNDFTPPSNFNETRASLYYSYQL